MLLSSNIARRSANRPIHCSRESSSSPVWLRPRSCIELLVFIAGTAAEPYGKLGHDWSPQQVNLSLSLRGIVTRLGRRNA